MRRTWQKSLAGQFNVLDCVDKVAGETVRQKLDEASIPACNLQKKASGSSDE